MAGIEFVSAPSIVRPLGRRSEKKQFFNQRKNVVEREHGQADDGERQKRRGRKRVSYRPRDRG
jgi:hypothetical protein